MQATMWRIGQLAGRTGVSVRALRHYDEIGLLSPSRRSDAGYRFYTAEDVARLQRIKSLRQLGFSLDAIRDLLDRPDVSPRRIVELHVGRLKEQMELESKLCRRLEALARRFSSADEISAEEFMATMEVMSMVENAEKYYTPGQLAELKERAQQVGPERLRQVEAEWPALMAQVRSEMQVGTDPTNERVQVLARRWQGLVEEFTGGNPGSEASLQNTFANEPTVRQRAGYDPELFAYIGQAMAAMKTAE